MDGVLAGDDVHSLLTQTSGQYPLDIIQFNPNLKGLVLPFTPDLQKEYIPDMKKLRVSSIDKMVSEPD